MDSRLFRRYNQQDTMLFEWAGKVKVSEVKKYFQVSGFGLRADGVKFQWEVVYFVSVELKVHVGHLSGGVR